MEENALFGGLQLPPALSSEETQKLLESNNRQALIEHNLRLVVHCAKKFHGSVEFQDLISIGTISLIKAVNTFDTAKGTKLATYASKCIDNEILMYFRQNFKYNNIISLETPLSTDNNGNSLFVSDVFSDSNAEKAFQIQENREVVSCLFTYALNNLSNKEKIVFLYKLGKRTQIQIEKSMGISQSYVSRIIQKIQKKLKNKDDEKIKGNEAFIFLMENNDVFILKISRKWYNLPFLEKKYQTSDNYIVMKFPICEESFITIAELLQLIIMR